MRESEKDMKSDLIAAYWRLFRLLKSMKIHYMVAHHRLVALAIT